MVLFRAVAHMKAYRFGGGCGFGLWCFTGCKAGCGFGSISLKTRFKISANFFMAIVLNMWENNFRITIFFTTTKTLPKMNFL